MSQDAPHQPQQQARQAPWQAPPPAGDADQQLRAAAVKRLEARRGLGAHALAYVLVNGFLVVIWWMNGTEGFFWPAFPILGWGIGLAFNAWDVLFPGPSEERIRAEMDRLRRT
ncbi:MAG: 2TM domain-containing protein [Actinotalea sp.]|nr:2TM domain-containing protein [Actinotalea sp.]